MVCRLQRRKRRAKLASGSGHKARAAVRRACPAAPCTSSVSVSVVKARVLAATHPLGAVAGVAASGPFLGLVVRGLALIEVVVGRVIWRPSLPLDLAVPGGLHSLAMWL